MNIFLSHNNEDKPVVEPVAIRLAEIFGKDKVFYDAWSIQPGDGIIDKMNKGMASPDFVFFFVSERSLSSKMVELEWQNAVYKSTKGLCKIIPIRIDNIQMPPILLQNLYIDMYQHGIEVALHDIVSCVQGNNTFTPQHQEFSNLTVSVSGDVNSKLELKVSAAHLMEPNPFFLVLLSNKEDEVKVGLSDNTPSRGGFNPNIPLEDGSLCNGFAIAPLGGAITPKIPLRITIEVKAGSPIQFVRILHRTEEKKFTPLPMQIEP